MEFILPATVFVLAALGFWGGFSVAYVFAIAIGLWVLLFNSAKKLFAGQFSLDYIAILAMIVALATREFGAGSVVSLMILVSEALEDYSSREAEAALKKFVERIPKTCEVETADGYKKRSIHEIKEGDVIFIRPNEIVPLDGRLVSGRAFMDEANLTGEMEPQSYRKGQLVKSGLINLESSIELKVVGDFSGSTYQKIVNLVQEAKAHPARTVRLAEKYNYPFTAVTLIMAAAAYALSRDPSHFLAVLVIATPCPLLIAAPVSFLGGLNRASRKNIVVKRPAALETLSEVTAIFFDKTGTLTLGEPRLEKVRVLAGGYSEEQLLAAAAAIEMHSLHPLAKAVLRAKAVRRVPEAAATDVHENIGDGIAGKVDGRKYILKKSAAPSDGGIAIDVSARGVLVGQLLFEDEIKSGTGELLKELGKHYAVAVLTGDTKENAEKVLGGLGVSIHARCFPEDKFAIVKAAQQKGGKVMMVGDGLNDAPALALADVGVVFSGSENSASIEAAAVAILSRNVGRVGELLAIANRSTRIARESILWGIGLSVIGMVFAMLGFIPPVTGAILQEGIDASVILNALRSVR
ncbi:MAG: cadmium-translocating P-type ATPase [Patescibacteria group bacterium]|nr:cadmium-translocating P-type ATPase [Patescibacteria group bacterium]